MTLNEIPIIYQDHHLLVVNKPAGLVIHPTYKNADGTMWDVLLVYLAEQGKDDWQPPVLPDEPQWAGAPEHIQVMLREKRVEQQWKEDGLLPRPCLLHRLDKDTSGVVALARSEQILVPHLRFQGMLRQRMMYHAICPSLYCQMMILF